MKITLCGSTKFKEEFILTNKILTLQGHLVYSVSVFGHSGDVLSDNEKTLLDLVHLLKIQESDAVCLVGHGESSALYIGEGTAREIRWAKLNNKPIFTLGQKSHVLTNYLVQE